MCCCPFGIPNEPYCCFTLLFAGGGLRVLRVGEPVKVRSSLQRYTLRAQVEAAVAKDTTICEAREEQRSLRQQLRTMRKSRR